MSELRDALADISAIRGQLARAIQFRGYGPTTLAATGILALMVAAVQARTLKFPTDGLGYLVTWICTAAAAVMLIGIETVTRVRRAHRGLAMHMLYSAAEQFLPPILTGVLLTVVLVLFARESLWMLPGLWQLFFAHGAFASSRFLPRATFGLGLWYLGTGLTCLALGKGKYAFSPWEMGVPFGLGQLLVAAVLKFDSGTTEEE